MRRVFLIVFSGIDGSGKSTQAQLLMNSFKRDGLDVSYIYNRWEPFLMRPFINIWNRRLKKKSPGSGSDLHMIKVKDRKRMLSKPFFRRIWFLFFFVDYGLQLFIKIRIQLLKKRAIVSDRMFHDSIIDKAVELAEDSLIDTLDSSWIRVLYPQPDMVIYVDCPEKIAFSRKTDIPDIDYLSNRRRLYLQLAEKYEWIKVDGTLPVEEIAKAIKDEVYRRLRCQKL